MTKLQTMKSLSLMSPKPMGLFLFKKRDVLSFAEMILQRANPIFLGIENDTVRFFLKQQEIEKSVVHHHHLHKQDIKNSYVSNNKNLSNTKNLKVRDILYRQEGNSNTQTEVDNNHYILNNNVNSNNLSNKAPSLSFLKNAFESETSMSNTNTTSRTSTKEKPEKLTKEHILSFYQNEHKELLHNRVNLTKNFTLNKHGESYPFTLQNIIDNSKKDINNTHQNSSMIKKQEALKKENILNFYQNEHKELLDNRVNSTKNFTFHTSNESLQTFPKHKMENFSTLFYPTIDKEKTNQQINTPIQSSSQNEVIKNHYNHTSEMVKIIHKNNSLKTERTEASTTLSSKHIDTQNSHTLNTPLIIKDGLEVVNNYKEEQRSIINHIETKLIQKVSHEVMEKVEAMWNREIIRRGGDYGI